ncbi:MAG: hypothetical protein HC906_00275 [Bacteroidales bacterium]|nr:hypothetical protein [Bacteroidales bacterium]
MKKLFYLYIFLFFTLGSAFSQIEKKTILLGAYSNLIVNTNGNNSFIVDPNSGLFITDNLCLGLKFPLLLSNGNFYWGAGPFARYYFKEKSNNSLFVSGALDMADLFNINQTLSTYNGTISAGIGNVWLITRGIGLEVQLISATDFNDVSFGLFLGFDIYYRK